MVRKLLATLMLVISIVVLTFTLAATGNAARKDFISYWSAGHMLVHGDDPYDAGSVFLLEKSAGFREPKPLIMRNPPFALALTLPLGFVDAQAGAVFWSLLIVAAIMTSVRLLWAMHGRPPDRLHLLGYAFAPALACMMLGQTSAFVLLGLVLFLRLHWHRPFAAGLSVALFTLKPHLFLVFGAVLLVWIVTHKAYSVLAGTTIALAFAALLPLCFDGALWSQYLPVLHDAAAESLAIPTFCTVLRVAVFHGDAWAQFIPAALGLAWAVWWFHRNRSQWDWSVHGSLLILLSVLVSPYSWFTDEIVVLPAILNAIYQSTQSERSLIGFGVINGIAVVEVLAGVSVGSGLFVWTTTAWLAWYVYATRGMCRELVSSEIAQAPKADRGILHIIEDNAPESSNA